MTIQYYAHFSYFSVSGSGSLTLFFLFLLLLVSWGNCSLTSFEGIIFLKLNLCARTLLPNCMSSSFFFICIFFPRTFFFAKEKSSESWDRRWENTWYRVKNVRQSLRSCYPQHHNLLNKFGTFVVITLTRSKSSSKSRILSSFRWAIRSFRSSMAILSAISSSAVCNKKVSRVIINELGDKKNQTITFTFLDSLFSANLTKWGKA